VSERDAEREAKERAKFERLSGMQTKAGTNRAAAKKKPDPSGGGRHKGSNGRNRCRTPPPSHVAQDYAHLTASLLKAGKKGLFVMIALQNAVRLAAALDLCGSALADWAAGAFLR
jgi:hypothetical protein